MRNHTLPNDFDPEVYLRLHPDVAAAGVDPAEHYLRFGLLEGRVHRPSEPLAHTADFVTELPSAQAVVDLFQGEWSSAFPPSSGLISKPGQASLFTDPRIDFAEDFLGPFKDLYICELGPLEAGHTYILHQRGAASIDAVESNKQAFLKCLCVKEVFGLSRAKFLLGDATAFLEDNERRFDVIIASGILYHMVDPLRLLMAISKRTDKLFIWTHYYSESLMSERQDRALFQAPEALDNHGRYHGSRRLYPAAALSWVGFSGGPQSYATWLERESIEAFLRDNGFCEQVRGFDHETHQNGPAFAVAARRKR